jgi:hypothetical protein
MVVYFTALIILLVAVAYMLFSWLDDEDDKDKKDRP